MIAFTEARPFTQFVPSLEGVRGGPPLWKNDIPFPILTARGAFSAQTTFRHALSSFLQGWPVDGRVRSLTTNYDQPTRLPQVVGL